MLTAESYKEQNLKFFRNEKTRSNILTKARIQPFFRVNIIILGYNKGIRVFPRPVTVRYNALFLHNNQLCLIWKSEGVSFNHANKELKDIFKKVDNYITEENLSSHLKYEFIPKKTDSHLTNFVVYDLETHNTDRARPYCISFYRLSKLARKYNRDLTQYEIEKCKEDTLVYDGDVCIFKASDFLLNFRGEVRKVKNEVVK